MSKINDKIDRYAIGKLSAEEAAEIEHQMAADPALQEELAFRRKLLTSLAVAHREDLKKKFSEFAERGKAVDETEKKDSKAGAKIIRLSHSVKFILALVAIAIISFGVWHLTHRQEVPPTPIVKEQPPQEKTEPPVAEIKEPATTQEAPSKETTPAPVPSKPEVKTPIAKADPANFEPDASMEELISGFRGESINLDLNSPKNIEDFRLNDKGETRIPFAGVIERSDVNLLLMIFNNKEVNDPVITVPLKLKQNAAGFMEFDLQQKMKVKPGLYYFSIEWQEKSEILHVGKFTIGKENL